MSNGLFRVLLIQDRLSRSLHLSLWLENHGCRCRIAHSFQEAAELFANEPFNLVLSLLQAQPAAIAALARLLQGSHADFFYAHPVEDGCWWLQAVSSGHLSGGLPALRPGEFMERLRDAVQRNIPVDPSADTPNSPGVQKSSE